MTRLARILALCVICVVLAAIPGTVKADDNISGDEAALERVEKLIAESRYSEAITLLKTLEADGMPSETAAKTRFFSGLATFNQVNMEILASRQKGLQKNDALQEHQIDPIKSALADFQAAHEIGLEKELAAECLFRIGRTLDWGYLQRFTEALDTYKQAADLYPETEFGRKSRERYETLSSKVSPHVKRSPHQSLGPPKGSSPH